MSDRELAAKFRGSAVEFQRLNPIDVFLLVRRVADPVESNDIATQTLIDQNKLQDRFGQVHSCSVVEVGTEWEQCILLVDLRSNITRRAFDDWQEVASHAAGLCQAASISPLFNRGHDWIVEFVMALEGELHSRKRTEFADLFKEKKGFEFDLTKGIVTSIEDTPKKSARLMEEYATRLGESSAVDAPKNQESGGNQATIAPDTDADNGFSEDGRTFRWRGKQYVLNLNPCKAVKILFEGYLRGEYWMHQEYIQQEAEIQTDLRHLVRGNDLKDLIVRQKEKSGKSIRGMWGLNRE